MGVSQITHPTATIAGLIRASPYVTIGEQTLITCRSTAPVVKTNASDEDENEADEETDEVAEAGKLHAIIGYAEEVRLPHTPPSFVVAHS